MVLIYFYQQRLGEERARNEQKRMKKTKGGEEEKINELKPDVTQKITALHKNKSLWRTKFNETLLPDEIQVPCYVFPYLQQCCCRSCGSDSWICWRTWNS